MKPRISVAEDDLALSEALQLLLEGKGYEEAEADDFLLKLFNINELLALIEKYVSLGYDKDCFQQRQSWRSVWRDVKTEG